MSTEADLKISVSLHSLADALSKVLDDIAGEHVLFNLIVFSNTDNGGRHSYIANAERADVIGEFKRLIEFWEAGLPDIPAHDYKG